MARHINLLHRRFGDRWVDLPTDIGRPAAAAETLLVLGPTALDPVSASPADVASGAWLVVRAATNLAEQVIDDAEVLGEALGSQIADLPLGELDKVIGAVLDLGLGSRTEPVWASPAAADAARIVLDAHGERLRETTNLHEVLYARFTDHVLDIPEARVRAGTQPWRLLARLRLRGALASASRTGRVPGGLTSTAREVLAVRESRRVLSSLTPILTRHLGRTGFGPLTDVDGLTSSLSAVRRLQRALGDRVDPARLSGLIAAAAFNSPELVAPATALRACLQTWRIEVALLCGGDPWAVPADELGRWAAQTSAVLPALSSGVSAMTELGRSPATTRELVDDLLLRENVAELGKRLDAWGIPHPATGTGSAL